MTTSVYLSIGLSDGLTACLFAFACLLMTLSLLSPLCLSLYLSIYLPPPSLSAFFPVLSFSKSLSSSVSLPIYLPLSVLLYVYHYLCLSDSGSPRTICCTIVAINPLTRHFLKGRANTKPHEVNGILTPYV